MERLRTIILVAGIAFFGFAFVVMGVSAYAISGRDKVLTVEEVIDRDGVLEEIYDLQQRWPEAFAKAFGEPATEADWKRVEADAVREGHRIYVSEACWHCHSQFVRPVSNEALRFGPVSRAPEYQNELQLPVLFGTRRVGPDLSREAKVRPHDWQAAHLYRPRSVAPTSVMPDYTWFFDPPPAEGAAPVPNRRGLSLIAYLQWLGSWLRTPDYGWKTQPDAPAGPAEAKAGGEQ
jgi:hypothetical protein